MINVLELSRQQLVQELDAIEVAIGRSATVERYADDAGHVCTRVRTQLLRLAEREHLIVTELRRRHRLAVSEAKALHPAAMVALTSGGPSSLVHRDWAAAVINVFSGHA